MRFIRLLAMILGLAFGGGVAFAQSSASAVRFPAASESLVTVIAKRTGTNTQVSGTGVVVRSDGLILTAYHLVKDAAEVQVKLQNGEIFDRAEVVKFDERRNGALLRIPLNGLPVAPRNDVRESDVGAPVGLLTLRNGGVATETERLLSALILADEVPGAGNGFRVLKFTGAEFANANGGVMVDNYGNVIGFLAALPEAKTQNYAVTIAPLMSLAFDAPTVTASASYTVKPAPPQVLVVKSNEPRGLLANSRTVYVDSRTTFFKTAQLVNEMSKRDAVKNWGWVFIDDTGYSWDKRNKADLEIELDHQVFTFNFTFTLKHRETGIILASGKVTIADGASGAPKMADRIIEKVNAVLNPPQPKTKDEKKKDDKSGKPASK